MKFFLPLLATSASILGGCAGPDRVSFVTSTELAVSADPSALNVVIGYDRTEAVIAPTNPDTLAVPDVAASLRSNGNVFSPVVEQVYATGQAAQAVTNSKGKSDAPRVCTTAQKGCSTERRMLVFGTSSTLGAKASWGETVVAGPQLPSISIGFKRREHASIPVNREGEINDIAPVMAGIRINPQTQTFETSGLSIEQFMATGKAAINLASEGCFAEQAKDAEQVAASSTEAAVSIQRNIAADNVEQAKQQLDALDETQKRAVIDLFSRCFGGGVPAKASE